MGEGSNNGLPKVHISGDGLAASIILPMPAAHEVRSPMSTAVLLNTLKDAGVIFGIDQEKVARLAESPVYDREIVVANGSPAVEGTPGYFQYNFDLTQNRKPTIREDGSTDYMNIKVIEVVHEGQVIVNYVPAVMGSRGMTVKGVVIEPKLVRDLPPLNGRGFTRSDDGLTYTASIDGKIDVNGNRILISPIWEIDGDVDITMGNIDFNGDVIIHGGVSDGAIIRAGGNITIHGLVENCEIHGGKDVFLLSGLKGGEKTILEVGGSLTAQFMEYAYITCKGDIIADYIFNSKVFCDGFINLNGNKAAIIGGYTTAVRGIDVNEVGNDFGTVTTLAAGVTTERLIEYDNLYRRVNTLNDNVSKIKRGLEEFERLGIEHGIDYKEDPRRLQLLRVKIRDEALILEEQAKLEKMKAVIDNGGDATIRVFKKSYPGVTIIIDDHKVEVKDVQSRVEYVKTFEGIRMDLIENMVRE